MSLYYFLKKNIIDLIKGDSKIILRKIFTFIKMLLSIPFFVLGIFVLPILYLVRPYYLVRFRNLPSNRIGHFAANTELYCCERDLKIGTPLQPYLDIFFFNDISNNHLAKMWKKKLIVLPSFILAPFFYLNNFFCNFFNSCKLHKIQMENWRDKNLLFEKTKPHLSFSSREKSYGQESLKKFGLKENSKFVCLIVRDSAYLANYQDRDWSYHDFRNCNIDNFILACEALTSRGYYVFRMGNKVLKKIKNSNPKIIDYANSSKKSEFLDIYLGANCEFCLTTATGFDCIPYIFRKPLASINVPLSDLFTYGKNNIHITRHHFSLKEKKRLSMTEIFEQEVDCSIGGHIYKSKEIILEEPTPEEVRDLAIEMVERLEGSWRENIEDIELQKKFSKKFKLLVDKKKNTSLLHGKIVSRFGANFLRKNKNFLS